MTLLKTTFIAAALLVTPAAFAQDAMTDKAKDMAVDVAKDKAKDMAADQMGDTGSMAADKAIDVGADMMKGESMKDAAMGAAADMGKDKAKSHMMSDGTMMDGAKMGTKMDGHDAMTAGKVMAKGGSMQDAGAAVAKDKMKDHMMDKAKHMMKSSEGKTAQEGVTYQQEGTSHQGTIKTPPPVMNTMPVPAQSTMAINCPYGTTAQPNGTCMITGDYKPRG